jgi:hypothetical protein
MIIPARRRLAIALAAIAFGALTAPRMAVADAPTGWTDFAENTAADAAILHGTVKLGGEPTRFHFEYAAAASDFCTSNGTSGTPGATTDQPAQYDGESVEAAVTGLTPGADVCFRIFAVNASGPGVGEFRTFTAGAPSAYTAAKPRNISATSSALLGQVYGAGQQVDYHFEWGVTPNCTTHSTSPGTVPPGDQGNVEATVAGLTPGSQYCFRLVATNEAATQNGSTSVFTAGLPQLGPPSAIATGPSTETLSQTVNPAGQNTTYHVEYDLFGSYYCLPWEHSLPPPNYSAPAGTLPRSAGETTVTTALGGLTPGAEYCSRLIVTNSTGASEDYPGDRWTAGAPAAQMIEASALGTTTARLRASVNPAGAAATARFKYAPLGTGACTHHDSPGASATPELTLPADTSDHEITTDIDGLAADASYCVWVVVRNDRTSVESGEVIFSTPVSGSPGPGGETSGPPLLRSFSVPARVTSPHFASIQATVDLGRPGTTVTLSAFRVVHGATGARVGRLHRWVAKAGRHRLTLALSSKSRRQLAGLAQVRLRTKLLVEGADGRRATRTTDLQLRRHG